jgi:uncharacterized protein (TIGR02453 family)
MAQSKRSPTEESAQSFTGFPAAGIQFLRDLKKNNDRDWFQPRKALYQEQVERPMVLLITETSLRCRKRGLMIGAKEKNPVMRVYRDIRFSPDKRPFKTHVGASLKAAHSKTSYGEIYVHISPEESFVAAGFWMPERPFLQAWRNAMVQQPSGFLKVVKALAKADLELSQERQLTRLPRGYDNYAEQEIARFLKLTSFVTSRTIESNQYRSSDPVDMVVDFALANRPLLEYGWSLGYTPKRDILDER